VRTIEVSGALSYMPEEAILKAVSPHIAKGFFWLDIQGIQDSIAQLPWVVSSSVKRVWLDKIQIALQEHTPQARFGETGVVDTEGCVFYPEKSSISDKLPLFKGPTENAYEMLQQYYTILESIGPLGLTVVELNLTSYGAWEMMLDNGIAIILGRTACRERLNRFVLAYKLFLEPQISNIAYVDCRYTNGLAIGYKTHI
jgi:cell division protein FtsQ